jgi:threonylcarbamoyladenosine tRNA methylthiotransferase MtaB
MTTSSIDVVTFGCRLNAYESEVARSRAEAAGLKDAIIVNTCAVTGEAVRQARQSIRRFRKERPNARIIVTGCAAQIEPRVFAAMPEVDVVLGNEEKLKTESYVPDFGIAQSEKILVNDIMSVRETAGHLIDGFSGRARAFVQVQNGCDHRCTFCIIPYGRGNSRSVPAGAVVDQIARLTDSGFGEIVLSGVDITSYGADLPGRPTLGRLIHQILDCVPSLSRLRLSSIDSIEADELLVEAVTQDRRVMPHLHLSVQSGDDLILKRMKRRHSRRHAIEFCARLRSARPDIAFGADFIVGFPTETDAMFENTVKLVDECGLTFLHVFPFSPRSGTPASRMPQVQSQLVRHRARRLRAEGAARLAAHLSAQTGRVLDVLVESGTEGRAADFSHVRLTRPMETGALARARVTRTEPDRLIAEPL